MRATVPDEGAQEGRMDTALQSARDVKRVERVMPQEIFDFAAASNWWRQAHGTAVNLRRMNGDERPDTIIVWGNTLRYAFSYMPPMKVFLRGVVVANENRKES